MKVIRWQLITAAAVFALLAGVIQAAQLAVGAQHSNSTVRDGHGQLAAHSDDEDEVDEDDQPQNGQTVTQTQPANGVATDDADTDDADDVDDAEDAD